MLGVGRLQLRGGIGGGVETELGGLTELQLLTTELMPELSPELVDGRPVSSSSMNADGSNVENGWLRFAPVGDEAYHDSNPPRPSCSHIVSSEMVSDSSDVECAPAFVRNGAGTKLSCGSGGSGLFRMGVEIICASWIMLSR